MPNEQDTAPSNNNQPLGDSNTPASHRDTLGPRPESVTIPGEVEPNTSSLNGTTSDSTLTPDTSADSPADTSAPVQPFGLGSSQVESTTSQPATFAPASDTASGATGSEPKKSKKKLIIGAVSAAVAVLLIGGGAAAYNLWYQNPDKVIGDALGNALIARSASTDTVITTKDTDAKSDYEVTLKTLSNAKDARIDATIKGTTGDATFNAGGSLLVKDAEKVFFKIDELKELLEQSGMIAYLGGSQSAMALIEKLDGSWVLIDKKDYEEFTGAEDEQTKCIEDTLEKLRTDEAYGNELRDLYKKYPLVTVAKQLGSKNGSLGYEIEFNRQNTISFTNGVNETAFYKDLKKCDSSIENLDGEELFKEDDSDTDGKAKVVVWVDRWTHQFTKLEVSGSSEGSSGTIVSNLQFDVPVTIDEPTDPITVDELKADIEAITQEMMQAQQGAAFEGSSMTSTSSFEI